MISIDFDELSSSMSQRFASGGGLKMSNRTSHAAVAEKGDPPLTWLCSLVGPPFRVKTRRLQAVPCLVSGCESPSAGRLFLFGGYDAEGQALNDLWILRRSGWARPVPAGEAC